jgi:hypothetical protein
MEGMILLCHKVQQSPDNTFTKGRTQQKPIFNFSQQIKRCIAKAQPIYIGI